MSNMSSFTGSMQDSYSSYSGRSSGGLSSGENESLSPSPSTCSLGKTGNKYTRKGANGKTLLVTPWCPQGISKNDLTLDLEVQALASMLQLTNEESSRRHLVRSTVQDALKSVWPGATVKVYGSFAYGLSLPGSSVDLLVEGLGSGLDDIEHALERLGEAGLNVVNWIKNPDAGYAKLVDRQSDITANVSFVRGTSTARKSVSQVRTLLARFPEAKTVFAVARLVLKQANCGDATKGGLSSYALLIMVLTSCYMCPTPEDSVALLTHFFRFYGDATTALFVEDPLNAENNLAEGCVRWPQIRSIFKNSLLSLEKWLSGKGGGYRGRSPLSSVLSYDCLWANNRPGEVQYLELPVKQ
eukprot:TRINITY_DN7884_c0_g1_i2.p1 TRINITY_DN7884_c0_g1~~TRINITY_DN7884_c0_g1_i2.p1  ORF type:complete len:356 (+),score=121.94 TRINITY_DN7884_c0_g1_i2:139-1206(+)